MAVTTGAVVLTGGGSRRMGFEKHAVVVDGRTVLQRTLDQLDGAEVPVCILGNEPIPGRSFLQDRNGGAGPATALAAYRPTSDFTLVVACDLPFFHADVLAGLLAVIGNHDAAVPLLNGQPQYLCALYNRAAFEKWAEAARDTPAEARNCSMREVLVAIDAIEVELDTDPLHISSFNTPEELKDLIEASRLNREYLEK